MAKMTDAGDLLTIGTCGVDGDCAKFPGFCSKHDLGLFREIEDDAHLASQSRRLHLQAYRSFCRELRRVTFDLKQDKRLIEPLLTETAAIMREIASEVVPPTALEEYLIYENLSLDRNLEDRLRSALESKSRALDALLLMQPAMDAFIEGVQPNSGIFAAEVVLPVVLPVALSGFGTITPQSPDAVPEVLLFVVALADGSETRLTFFGSEDNHLILHTFLTNKGVLPDPASGSAMRAALSLMEQMMVAATDHWFMSPEAWNKMHADTKERLCSRLNFIGESLSAQFRMSVFPDVLPHLPI